MAHSMADYLRDRWGSRHDLRPSLQAVGPAHGIRPAERSVKSLNDPHVAAAAWARWRFVFGRVFVIVIRMVVIHRRSGYREQTSAQREFVGAMAVRQEPVVTDAMKAIRHYVQKETAYEVGDLDAHHFALVPTTLPTLLPPEANMGLVGIDQASVGDSDTMGVAREIGQELFGTSEGLFGINDPFGCA